MEKDIIEEIEDFPIKNKRKALRRKRNVTKALRKQHISQHNFGLNWYNNLHQYSKNKIHCSCGMCRFKSTYNPDNKPMSDIRKIEAMNYQLKDYLTA